MIYAYNLALMRSDGKVETDTIYSEKLYSQETAELMSKLTNCEVVLSCIGTLNIDDDEIIKQRSWFSAAGKEKEDSNDDSIQQLSEQEKSAAE